MITTTLDAMAAGGIHDQLGGGFARYSTDDDWLVPHFEKMLYDNALLDPRVPARLPRHRRGALSARRRGHRRLRAARPAPRRAAASSPPRTPTPKASRASSTCWSLAEIREVCGDDADEVDPLLRRHRGGELRRSAHRLPRQHPARRRPATEDRRPRSCVRRCRAARAPRRTGAARSRRQGAARLERAVPRGAHRGRRRARPRRLDGRRPHQRALPPRASYAATTAASCGRGGRPYLAYAEDYAALLEALLTLAELDDIVWLAEARTVADELAAAVPRSPTAAASSRPGTTPRRSSCAPKDVFDDATPSANSLAANGLLRLAALTGDDRATPSPRSRSSSMLARPMASPPDRVRVPARRARTRRSRPPIEIAIVGDPPTTRARARSGARSRTVCCPRR